jgi:hypothetical protein
MREHLLIGRTTMKQLDAGKAASGQVQSAPRAVLDQPDASGIVNRTRPCVRSSLDQFLCATLKALCLVLVISDNA